MSRGSAIIRSVWTLWLGATAVGCTESSPETQTAKFETDAPAATGDEHSVNPDEGGDTGPNDDLHTDTGEATPPQNEPLDTGAASDESPTSPEDDSLTEAEPEDTGHTATEVHEDDGADDDSGADAVLEDDESDGDSGDTGEAPDPAGEDVDPDPAPVAGSDEETDTGMPTSGDGATDPPDSGSVPGGGEAPPEASDPPSVEDTGTAATDGDEKTDVDDESGDDEADPPADELPEPPPAGDPPADESPDTDPVPGDSCGDGFVMDCGLVCTLDSYIGDGICDDMSRPFGDWFACPHLDWDGGDCPSGDWPPAEPPGEVGSPCGDGMVLDCSHTCHSTIWLGDGWCDDETSLYGIHFDCSTFGDDAGDCATAP